jgi:hypothetical protein
MDNLEDLVSQPVQCARIKLDEAKRQGLILDYGIVDGDAVWIKPIPAVPMIDLIYSNGRFLNRNTDYSPTDHGPSLHKFSPSDIR